MIVDHFCLLQQYEIKQNQNTIAAIDHKRARLQDFFQIPKRMPDNSSLVLNSFGLLVQISP